jgi:hypothetical protein
VSANVDRVELSWLISSERAALCLRCGETKGGWEWEWKSPFQSTISK